MTCIRDIMNQEQLEREFDSIRKVFATLKAEEKPLRIEWGVKKAFEEMELPRRTDECPVRPVQCDMANLYPDCDVKCAETMRKLKERGW